MCSTNVIFWCFPPHVVGYIEAGLHCIYTGFFIIEATTYGLYLEQKFHGVLQILLINFYIVLLCILFIRWHVSRKSLGCHLFIALSSATLSVFIGQMIFMYLAHMEKVTKETQSPPSPDPMKMDLIILILDLFFYVMVTSTYVILLVRLSAQVGKALRNTRREHHHQDDEEDYEEGQSVTTLTTSTSSHSSPIEWQEIVHGRTAVIGSSASASRY